MRERKVQRFLQQSCRTVWGLEGAKMMHTVVMFMICTAFREWPLAWTIPRTMLGFMLERPCWSGPKKEVGCELMKQCG